MFPKGRKHTAVLTLVGLLVVIGPAGGGGLPMPTAGVAQEDSHEAFFSWAWRWMRSLWEKNGPCVDPDGRCGEKDGACIDPDGRCRESGAGSTPSQLDDSACIDPNGLRCAASASGR